MTQIGMQDMLLCYNLSNRAYLGCVAVWKGQDEIMCVGQLGCLLYFFLSSQAHLCGLILISFAQGIFIQHSRAQHSNKQHSITQHSTASHCSTERINMVQDTTRLSQCLQYWLQVRRQADKAAMGADSRGSCRCSRR